jgi:cobalamin biosynthesis protein CbiG
MLACGIGCRRGTSAEDIEAAIGAARKELRSVEAIAVIATEESKTDEPGLLEAARRFGIPLVAFSARELESVSSSLMTISEAALVHKGVPSVAEAAAILAAGGNARLLGPRVATPTTTCAFAVGEGRRA